MNEEVILNQIETLVDSVDSERDNNHLLVIGKVGDSYTGSMKGSVKNVTRSFVTIMAKNPIIKEIIISAASIYLDHEEDIKKLVEENFSVKSDFQRVENVKEEEACN